MVEYHLYRVLIEYMNGELEEAEFGSYDTPAEALNSIYSMILYSSEKRPYTSCFVLKSKDTGLDTIYIINNIKKVSILPGN